MINIKIVKTLAAFIIVLAVSSISLANEREGAKKLPPITNDLYKKECGACHFLYQPGLLPERSWIKLIDTIDKHFGEDASLDAAANEEIKKYLIQNSAEKSNAKRSKRILSSIKSNSTPVRISETPYIQDKHRKISKDVYKRESIKSLANCIACHKTADEGLYEDDDVVIPKK